MRVAMVVVVVACARANVVTIAEAEAMGDARLPLLHKPNVLQVPRDSCAGGALLILHSKLI